MGQGMEKKELVNVEHLHVCYKSKKKGQLVHAVDDVSFALLEGETLALVGESGCGKTTTGKALLSLVPITEGTIKFEGKELSSLKSEEMRLMRRDMQFIFQDPYASLNPRMKAGQIIRRPLDIYAIGKDRAERKDMMSDMMRKVGLSPEAADRYPHEFSGGQRQRISIARALITRPRLIVADEPTSALDVSIQCQILDLMMELKSTFHLTMLFVSHDLSVVNYISDRTIIMYLGNIVEVGKTRELFRNPCHPYSKALLESIPSNSATRKKEHRLIGDIAGNMQSIAGCSLFGRCPCAQNRCQTERPLLRQLNTGRSVACHRAEEFSIL